jgi:DNA uptake protein ComE-like DNA-binding protein
MTNRIRVNLANPRELIELLGISEAAGDTIIRFRRDHGPIVDEQQLAAILGGQPLPTAIRDRLDFSPSEPTAPEAPGA